MYGGSGGCAGGNCGGGEGGDRSNASVIDVGIPIAINVTPSASARAAADASDDRYWPPIQPLRPYLCISAMSASHAFWTAATRCGMSRSDSSRATAEGKIVQVTVSEAGTISMLMSSGWMTTTCVLVKTVAIRSLNSVTLNASTVVAMVRFHWMTARWYVPGTGRRLGGRRRRWWRERAWRWRWWLRWFPRWWW